MFLGSHQHTIDDKGRLTLPAKWRVELASGVVVTRGLDNCIFILPQPKFDQMAQQVVAQGFESVYLRDWTRYLFGMAEQADIDKQGRILMPQNLRAEFQLARDVIVVGLYDRIEVWEPKKYAEMTSRIQADPAAMAEQMRVTMRGVAPKKSADA